MNPLTGESDQGVSLPKLFIGLLTIAVVSFIIVWNFKLNFNDWVTLIVCAIICCLVVKGIAEPDFRRRAPSLMTSLGIFGTFVGILLALLPFDNSLDKIDTSIEVLLSGMKTAFISSCFGLGASIGSKFFWGSSDYKNQPITPGEQDIIHHLAVMSTEIRELRRENREQVEKLMEVINKVLTDNLKALIDDIREVVTKQLGETLKTLIEDINKALIDQFGKTIPEFKEAVDLLNVWQKENKQHIEELTIAFNNASGGIKSVENSCEKISETMESVDVIIVETKTRVDELNEILATFATMKDDAEKAFPTISKNLEYIGKRLAESAEGLKGSKDTIEKSHEKLSQEIGRVIENMTQEWGNNLVAIAKKCQETIEDVEKQNQIVESNKDAKI